MTDRKHILRFLLPGRATSDAIAIRLKLNAAAVYSALKVEETAGNVICIPIFDGANWELKTWQITPTGRSLVKPQN